MAANAAEGTLEDVLRKMDELAQPEERDWDDVLAEQPGPEKTGELGIVLDDDEEDSE